MRPITFAVCLALLFAFAASQSTASESTSREALVYRLESRADMLRREITTGSKLGAVEKRQYRNELRATQEVLARLEAGDRPDESQLAAAFGREPETGEGRVVPARLRDLRQVSERKLRTGSRVGAVERSRIRAEINEIDDLIADLERGQDVDLARLDRLIAMPDAVRPVSASERRENLEMRQASMERSLLSGPKVGVLERARIRSEIDQIDALISTLEGQE